MDVTRGEYVHDLRHRYSYELRPDRDADRRLRAFAAGLEARGLLEPGAATAPRLQPHLTLLRASAALDPTNLGLTIEPGVRFTGRGSFGDGRIEWLAPAVPDPLVALRSALVDHLGPEALDPLVQSRPWTPHLTVAYAVPERARAEVAARTAAALPFVGRWASLDVWDLDVRPTRLLHRLEIA